ncbi:hypothetical protein [Pseudomonas solani]|uniref:hypothetical protein n=1 Tax=Pseudomonas solani TaxID=2731552 RepID=UPI003D6A6811
MDPKKLEILMNNFINESDTNISASNNLESLLDDHFPDDEFVQQTVEMLSCYRSEGGDFLFNKQQIQKRLIETRTHLEQTQSTHN